MAVRHCANVIRNQVRGHSRATARTLALTATTQPDLADDVVERDAVIAACEFAHIERANN
jgi:hypothetical protein